MRILLIACSVILFCLYTFWCAPSAQAAEIRIVSDDQVLFTGETLTVDVLLDTDGETINTVESHVEYPRHLLDLTEIRTSGSIVSSWIERSSTDSGTVKLSGIIPYGFTSVIDPLEQKREEGLVARFVFRAREAGSGAIAPKGSRVLLHDGVGTDADVANKPLNIVVQTHDTIEPPIDEIEHSSSVVDDISPEPFAPSVSKVPDSDKYHLFFVTRDIQTGIDHYEVKEGDNEWRRAESPYLLRDQTLQTDISVRAIDKAGNVQEETLSAEAQRTVVEGSGNIPRQDQFFYQLSPSAILLFIILLLALFLVVLKKRREKDEQ